MTQTNYDSELCGSLPIHLTNLIQPHGILVVVEADTWKIIQASENTESVFSKPASVLVNTSLTDHVDARNLDSLRQKLSGGFTATVPATWAIGGSDHLVLVHPRGNLLVAEIELEPVSHRERDSFVNIYQELKFTISSIEATRSVADACALAAKELKRISGFDKVMIYSFDAEWNGTVLAEEKEPEMESYMGFTFPASDIPRQARQLYLRNPYRLIPDRNYKPVKLFPVVNPVTGSFIELSDCNLRSVAAVHIEYLRNMGVTASMSVRILDEGALWGLIACHHQSPKNLNYEMCSIFELLSGIISVKLSSLRNQQNHSVVNTTKSDYSNLIESIYKSQDLEKSLMSDQGILKLFSASGAVIAQNGKYILAGETPGHDQLEELLLWIHTRQLKKTFYTESLGNDYDYAREYAPRASGMLVIPVNYSKDYYLILFRPEQVRVINWGGNPNERIQFEKDQKNYHPRNSFKQWQEKVSGVSLPWRKEEVEIAETLRSFIYEYETSEN